MIFIDYFIRKPHFMIKKLFAYSCVGVVLFASTLPLNAQDKTQANHKLLPNNPFYSPSKLPFQVPDFSVIKNADYKEALEAGIEEQMAEIQTIANNKALPTFQNTLVALEKTGQLLTRANNAFNLVSGANTNPELQELQELIAPKLTAIQDAIYLNSKLFKRVETIYNNRATLNLDAESKRLLAYQYQQFLMAGAKLSYEEKEKLKQLNAEEASLGAKFGNQLLAAAKVGALVVDNIDDLKGLSVNDLDVYAQNAKAKKLEGKWLIPLKNTTQQPALQSLQVRQTRENLFKASWSRAEKNDSNDTRVLIAKIASIRAEKAKLMGFESYAAWKLQDQMAKTPAAVNDFFAKLIPSVTKKAKLEAAEIQKFMDEQKAGITLEPWDWDYYAEQVRKAKYNLDEKEVKPYFQLNMVLERGVFFAAKQIYGLTFKERKDIPVYQSDVRVFEVLDKDDKTFALFYCDYYKRDNKNGGAWMSNLVGQSKLLGTKPVIYNVCNFSKPSEGQPALISFDDVTTMFHEFGHALHGLFANQQYPTLSGTNVARDYVEFPSQFNEHWALHPTVLKNYAVHYQTGETIPQSLIDKIKRAGSFNGGYKLTEAIAAASLDLQWHNLKPGTNILDAGNFEKESLLKSGLNLSQVPPRYRSSYFLHIWGNGYAAGYYAYQWTKMLEEDAYSWFEENGGLTRANGQRFRDLILSKGNSEDYNTMFLKFRGHQPDIKAMQKYLELPK